MSEFSVYEDISDMHTKFGVNNWVRNRIEEGNYDILKKFLVFRLACIQEELDETTTAVFDADNQEIVDGLIDIMVFTIGTLDILGVNGNRAWKEVHRANISKEVGIKEGRPNPFGLPDLIKPKGWSGPDHSGNEGLIDYFVEKGK